MKNGVENGRLATTKISEQHNSIETIQNSVSATVTTRTDFSRVEKMQLAREHGFTSIVYSILLIALNR